MKKLAFLVGCMASMGGLAGGVTLGCGGSGQITGTGGAGDACQPGTFRNCSCDSGGMGTQTCVDEGKMWGACVDCSTPFDAGNGSGGSDAAPTCGDNLCNGAENCVNCPNDCGDCPACSLAPSCTGASSVPSSPEALASFNNAGQTMYTSGVGLGEPPGMTDCSDPLLKMRASQVLVHKNGDPGSLEIFCLVQADDGQSSQLMLTPDYMNISDNNPPLVLSPAAGTFWGQAANGIKLSQFNITVTYQCFMVLQPGVLQSALTAISELRRRRGRHPGQPLRLGLRRRRRGGRGRGGARGDGHRRDAAPQRAADDRLERAPVAHQRQDLGDRADRQDDRGRPVRLLRELRLGLGARRRGVGLRGAQGADASDVRSSWASAGARFCSWRRSRSRPVRRAARSGPPGGQGGGSADRTTGATSVSAGAGGAATGSGGAPGTTTTGSSGASTAAGSSSSTTAGSGSSTTSGSSSTTAGSSSSTTASSSSSTTTSSGNPGCGAGTCSGCCESGACQQGLSNQACGKDGVACIDCSAESMNCLDGFCTQ